MALALTRVFYHDFLFLSMEVYMSILAAFLHATIGIGLIAYRIGKITKVLSNSEEDGI